MAIAQSSLPSAVPPQPMTWEDYLAEGEVNARYDIVDGVRIYMPAPIWRHQRISKNVTRVLSNYEDAAQDGMMVSAPLDVLIQQQPPRTRQPDALYISYIQLAQVGGPPPPNPLPIAPELVVEILSPSDTPSVLADKLADYQRIGVRECWLLHPDALTVEVFILTWANITSAATYHPGQNVQSIAFPNMIVSVDALFAA